MNPLLSLWLFVLLTMAGITMILWLAEHYSHLLGNFYVLVGLLFVIVLLSRLIVWVRNRIHRSSS